MIKFIPPLSLLLIIVTFSSCEKTPGACMQLVPEKDTIAVLEEISIDTRCAGFFSFIRYDFGDGESILKESKEGEIFKKVYKFKGDYILRVTFLSKSRKRTSFEERRIIVK
jgi:hypothetical protein